ncbi:M15 family metallopeptidase [Microbulbifer echini]|uniref:M15 family metallopeptidase n=1 Tax=Microbulbifer echini TaxID=1529067 RepID=A0ABV4NR41_9GAMM
MLKSTVAALLILVIFACTKNPLSDISVDDFHPEAQVGIYTVSQSECALMRYRKIIKSDSPVGCERLRKVVFNFFPISSRLMRSTFALDSLYRSIPPPSSGIRQRAANNVVPHPKGAVIVLDVVAGEVLNLFGELYRLKFPIKSAIPIEYFSQQERVTEDMNNTLAFDSRFITNETRWSEHAYGVAIDINPIQNPYLDIENTSRAEVIPRDATEGYLNRAKYRVGKPVRVGMTEDVALVFAKHGFAVWGGDWNTPIDYMHFQVGSRQFIDYLVALPLEGAKVLFRRYVSQLNQCLEMGGARNDAALLRKSCVEEVTAAFEPQ